jgi:hypothetical protein
VSIWDAVSGLIMLMKDQQRLDSVLSTKKLIWLISKTKDVTILDAVHSHRMEIQVIKQNDVPNIGNQA